MPTSRPVRTAGSSASSAAASLSAGTARSPSTPSKRSTYRRSAPSPCSRTSSTIARTSSATDSAPGASEWTRTAALSASLPKPIEKRSTLTQPPQHLVDRLGPQLVRDRVRDEPGRRDRDLLPDGEAVLAQRRPGRGQVDDRLDEPGQRRELDRALDLDDLRLAPRALEEVGRDPRVLRRDAHDAEPAQRLGGRIGLLVHARQHHGARPVAEVEQLEHRALGLLHQHVLAGEA